MTFEHMAMQFLADVFYDEWQFGDVQYFDLDDSPALDNDNTED